MADTPALKTGTLWTVESQQEIVGTGPNGVATRGLQISFVTVSGKRGSVFVPDSALNAQTVRQAVTERAQLLESIGQLSG